MKIAILGSLQNGVNLAKYGIGELDEVLYIEFAPSAVLHTQGLVTHHQPRTIAEFEQALTDNAVDAYISLESTTRYGKDYDLDAALGALGLTKLLGASTTLKEVEYDRYAQRSVATASGLDTLLIEAEGTKAAIKDTLTYPVFVKVKGSTDVRPAYITSADATAWNKIDDAAVLWAEPALPNATLLNVNYIICNGSARIVNAIGMSFEDTSRFYGKTPTFMPLDDAFITSKVQPYIDAQATAHNTEKAFMSVQFLVDGGTYYFLENNCHPSIVVPWKGMPPITEVVADQASFDATLFNIESFTLSVKKAVDIGLPFNDMQLAIDNVDVDVFSILMQRDFLTTPGTDIYKMSPTPESAVSGIVFYLYNGAVVNPAITNLTDKV